MASNVLPRESVGSYTRRKPSSIERFARRNASKILGVPFRAYVQRQAVKEASEDLGRTNERPIEYGFVFQKLNQYQPASVLDVGTGQSALPSLMHSCGFRVDAIDNIKDYWPDGTVNRHYPVAHDDIRRPATTNRYDLITCISTLEHILEHTEAVRSMARLLNPGGHLLITCPYQEDRYHPNVYRLPDSYGKNAPFPTQQYSRAELERWMRASGLAITEQQYWLAFEPGAYWSCGPLQRPISQTSREMPHQLTLLDLCKNGD